MEKFKINLFYHDHGKRTAGRIKGIVNNLNSYGYKPREETTLVFVPLD